MPKFKALFSFSKKEVALFYLHAARLSQVPGLKLLIERTPGPEQVSLTTHGKLLIVIPRKVGKACIRNRIRRQIRAFVYENNLLKVPFRFVLVCYPEVKALAPQDIQTFLATCFAKTTV